MCRCLQVTTDVQLTPQSTSGSHHGTCSSTSPCEVEPQCVSAASDDAYHNLKPLQDRHEVLYLSWKAVPESGTMSDFQGVLGYSALSIRVVVAGRRRPAAERRWCCNPFEQEASSCIM